MLITEHVYYLGYSTYNTGLISIKKNLSEKSSDKKTDNWFYVRLLDYSILLKARHESIILHNHELIQSKW